MKINIGENLKKLRLSKGLTQEQAAEVFGVSAQAVSRWENNTAYPDITLLPGIAMFYDTSIDAFVGMDEIRSEERIRWIHGQVISLVSDGQADEAINLLRDSLKCYPKNAGLLLALGETLAQKTDSSADTMEAIAVAERALRFGELNMKTQSTAVVNLIFLYLRAGGREKAEALVKSLPHIWESREIIMPEICEREDYPAALRECILKVLVFLCGKIDTISERNMVKTPEYLQLGVDFKPQKTADEMLTQISTFLNMD